MENSFREEIISKLKTGLLDISTTNGYATTIKEASSKIMGINDAAQLPSAHFWFGGEGADVDNEDPRYEQLELELNLVVFIEVNTDISKSGLLTDQAEKIIKDISKYFYRDESINSSKVSQLHTIKTDNSRMNYLVISQRTPYLDYQNNKGAIHFIIKILYRHIF